MSQISVKLRRWEDGQRVEKLLQTLDRWEVHASDDITVTAGGIDIRLQPQPQLISAARVGVGAALWDSALVLTAYFGLGLCGIFLAKMGAQAVLTDLPQVLPATQTSIAINQLSQPRLGTGYAEACELTWGSQHSNTLVAGLAAKKLDYVIAADACYDDQDGQTPDPEDFFSTCSMLCTPSKTRVLLAVERRKEATVAAFMACARRHLPQVKRLAHPTAKLCRGATHIELYEISS